MSPEPIYNISMGTIGPAVGESSQTSDRWQAVGEMFYQHQICPSLHLTLDLQIASGDDLDCLNSWPACALVLLFVSTMKIQK